MIDSNHKPSVMHSKRHEHYFELCALATTGTLTDQEWCELKAHLAKCPQCGKLVQEYREMARNGMAMLMPEQGNDDQAGAGNSWSPELASKELFARIARDEAAPQYHLRSSVKMGSKRRRVREWIFRPTFQPLLGYAAAILLLVTMTLSAYHFGARAGQELAGVQVHSANQDQDSVRSQLRQLKQERVALDEQAKARLTEYQRVSEQLKQQNADVEKWKSMQGKTSDQLQQQTAAISELRSQYRVALSERDLIARKLQDSEAELETVQKKFDALQGQQSAELLRTASLETRIEDLSVRLKESDSALQQHQRFLSSDRDIRELMGARELYIADVFDVDLNGKTRKPFGRVFYTKEKSLIFYAFDLDQQPKPRNASIFQAWGRRGLNDKRPLNMGIFYLDNETNKRWVLRFDDPAALAQIDAVFVTVEPHSGGQKPSGKQLLFASLRSVPNHP